MKSARRFTKLLATLPLFFATIAITSAVCAQDKTAPTAVGAEPILKAIPDNALGFLLIRNIGKTDGDVSNLIELVRPQVPSLLALLKLKAGIQEALDENGSAAVALVPESESPDAKPVPLIYLPVTDYKKFIGQLQPDDANAEITGITLANSPMVVGHKGAFAVLTISDKKDQLSRALAATASVDSVVDTFLPWIEHHQASIVATPRGTKLAIQAAIAGLKNLRQIATAFPTGQNPQQVQMGFKLYDSLLSKAADEVEAFGVGVRLDSHSNVFVDSRTTFLPGSGWAKAFKGLKPSKETRFAGLPASPFMFAADGVFPKKWASGLSEFSMNILNQMNETNGGEKLSDEEMKKYYAASSAFMKGLNAASFLMLPPKSGESIYDGLTGIMKVDNSKKYLEEYEKSLKIMSEFSRKQANPMFNISDVHPIELEGTPGLQMTMDLSAMIAAQRKAMPGHFAPQLFGTSGKVTVRALGVDEHTVVLAYGSEEHAKEALANYKNKDQSAGLASDPGVEATLKLLPSRAQWIGVMSLQGYLEFIRNIMPPAVASKIPDLPSMPPIGFAAEGSKGGLTTELVVPAAAIAKLSTTFQHIAQPQEVPEK
jgi:hypothetical protein